MVLSEGVRLHGIFWDGVIVYIPLLFVRFRGAFFLHFFLTTWVSRRRLVAVGCSSLTERSPLRPGALFEMKPAFSQKRSYFVLIELAERKRFVKGLASKWYMETFCDRGSLSNKFCISIFGPDMTRADIFQLCFLLGNKLFNVEGKRASFRSA